MLDLIIVHHALFGHNVFQKHAKPGNVPLTVAQFVEQPIFGLVLSDLECQIE